MQLYTNPAGAIFQKRYISKYRRFRKSESERKVGAGLLQTARRLCHFRSSKFVKIYLYLALAVRRPQCYTTARIRHGPSSDGHTAATRRRRDDVITPSDGVHTTYRPEVAAVLDAARSTSATAMTASTPRTATADCDKDATWRPTSERRHRPPPESVARRRTAGRPRPDASRPPHPDDIRSSIRVVVTSLVNRRQYDDVIRRVDNVAARLDAADVR